MKAQRFVESNGLASASYRRDLGNGLVQRWSSAADAERVAQLMGLAWRSGPDDPPNPRVMDQMRRCLSEAFPLMGLGDCALVEDTSKSGQPVVACASLLREEWAYEGIPFGIGRPENVATDLAYRNRGLVRGLMEMLHARSAAEGHLVQAISGIPHFYRQFGYEYALDFGGRRLSYLSLIPAPPDVPEAYRLRPAQVADIPQLMELYVRRRSHGIVWPIVSHHYWQYQVEQWSSPAEQANDPMTDGKSSRIHVIVDSTERVCGYAIVATKRWGPELHIYELEVALDVNLQALVAPLLRALQDYGPHIPAVKRDVPFHAISFSPGRTHPIYEALGQSLAPYNEPPDAWYIRVPELPVFIWHIAPALERRLVGSPVAGYTGVLHLTFYRGGLRMAFESGRLMQVEPWRPPPVGSEPDAGFPALIFLQLIFGYRSLDELRRTFPDVWASHEAALPLQTLFPARPSWVMQL